MLCQIETRLLLCVPLLVARSSLAADTVVYRTAASSGTTNLIGEVLDYTGSQLTLRRPSGKQERLDTSRVVEVRTTWGDACLRGDERFAAHDYSAALAEYRDAFRKESRSWAQRRILARLVRCLHNLDRDHDAAEAFLLLYQSDPTTLFFSEIPLAWTSRQGTAAMQQLAARWLDDESEVARLIAASWLIPTAKRASAFQALTAMDARDPRVNYLAEAQLWRRRTAEADGAEVNRWQSRVNEMPQYLRAGPYYTLGLALSQTKQHRPAARAFLRVPIHFPEHRRLAASALLAAGRELEQLGRTDAATPLYVEVRGEFPGSEYADQAQDRLEKSKD